MTKRFLPMLGMTVILIVVQAIVCCGQGGKVKTGKVKLLDWKSNACDNTYDPYKLVNRITERRTQEGVTFLIVNFTDNCCAQFKPQIVYKGNQLLLLPYKEYSGDYCDCSCCFTIEFKIDGLPADGYETYFNGKKVEVASDHYKVVQPTSETYKGITINRTNRYGFREGMWMAFYEDGNIKGLEKYPESELYYESQPLWQKSFTSSGKLSGYSSNDTTETWFEDGELKAQFIDYKVGDTTYRKEFTRYENRQVHKNALERYYPFIFRSEFNPKYESKGSRRETVYEEEFFENGNFKYRFGKDTTFAWHPSGKIASREFGQQKIEYDENGLVTERAFHWKTKGPGFWGDMNNSLYANIGRNGKVLKIHFVRDEPVKGGIAPGVHYYWTWDEDGKLTKAPEKWNEEFPWIKFKEVIVP
jgi:hypothetical protein